MNKITLVLFLVLVSFLVHSAAYKFTANDKLPFGQYNPAAPSEVNDFELLMGRAECLTSTRIDKDNWTTPVDMMWTFKYIMNGMAVQDEVLRSDGTHAGSIRQYNNETELWLVYFYSNTAFPDQLPTWVGGKEGADLVFSKAQQAPNGTDGKYRVKFFDITPSSYEWVGEWVDLTEQIVYPTRKISCKKKPL